MTKVRHNKAEVTNDKNGAARHSTADDIFDCGSYIIADILAAANDSGRT